MSSLVKPNIETGEVIANFNQNTTSLMVATCSGYNIYTLQSVDSTLEKIYSCKTDEIYIIERFFESAFVAIVTQRAPRHLKLCNFKKQLLIKSIQYENKILAVKLNKDRLIVCHEQIVYIYKTPDLHLIHAIKYTPKNVNGLIALSPSSPDHCYLAYPGSVTSGEVQIFNTTTLEAKIMISAHDSPLAAITFNPSGTEIATASERGMVIKVFSSLNGAKLFELRRGIKRSVSITSLSFSTCAEYLVSSSNTETVHIFRLDRKATENAESTWMGFLSRTVTSYMPSQVTNIISEIRAFATVTMPVPDVRRICAISTIQNQLRLLIASQDGYLYVYTIPSVEGNECKLIRKHHLRDDHNDAMDDGGAHQL